jgi:hypothetical protein
MNSSNCCQTKPRAGDDAHQQGTRLRRVREVVGLILPGMFLALMPKCPMCLAAYVALGTGFTLSYTSAHLLMRALTALCISTLAFCVVRRMMKYLRQKHPFKLQPASTPQ